MTVDRFTIMPFAVRQAASDSDLTPHEKLAMQHFWLEKSLSPAEFLPMKAESLGSILKVKRQSASRILKHLVARGYLETYDPPDRSLPRLYLLLQFRRDMAA